MKTKVEVLESGATKLTVTIEAAEIDARIKKTYKDFGAKYRFPGFRPGHVPRPVIDSNLGKDAVRSTVTDELLNESFPLAVDENDLNMISQPKFGDVEGLVEEGKDFTFSAEFEVKPALELSDYSPVHIEVPFKTASEAEIDEQIEALGNYYYDYKNAPANTKVKQENSVEITLVVKDDKGEVMESLGAEDRLYEMGQGLFPAAFDEALLGMKKGETKSITLNVAENPCMMTSILKDKTEEVTFEIEVKAVKKKVAPEVTDEWVKETLGFADVAELRVRMGESIEQQKGDIIPRIMENNALFALQERLIGEVPAVMAEEAERDLLQNFFTQLQNQGATLDAYLKAQDITADKFKEDVKLQAVDTVKQNLALDAWARHAGIEVSDEEIVEEFKNSGAQDPDALYAEWKAQGRLHIVREGIMRGKALEALLAEADVEEVETPAAEENEEKPAKKTSAKKTSKKAAASDEEAPAAE
ncbi:trigger factor [Slackia faecicanis]|uniref:Trigger factor n=1 Tax=Slackia faecicanis TaxID=255723 RepID=A0A3N0AGU2_9ACTN|nr:trigger factor [Slackia faecicanis]MDO5358587.1 trigger factor [Slackia faecicanis]RNL21339.1 trigger factor [Slackia faecicanis]